MPSTVQAPDANPFSASTLHPSVSLTGARTLSLRAAPQVGLDSINCSGINTPSYGPSFYGRSRVDWT
ncbi:hypothetical protein V6N13_048110 [Hibiscus sabdariffa]|uniref:Uncharacterized protein n=1 Tax=Hibiscus sabdariffa TaxID=183260 RepID=A0ABR2F678_9ROSI